jgi:hypothetical protein
VLDLPYTEGEHEVRKKLKTAASAANVFPGCRNATIPAAMNTTASTS